MCLLSCGACLAQIILFILNFLLSLVSLAVTGLGVYALIQVNDADLEYANTAPIIVIVVGCVFTAIFFCGYCGAFCRNKCLLSTYAAITILLATATVVFTVFIFKGVDNLKETTEDALNNTLADPNNREALNWIEATLGCCGTTGPEFYNSSIPISCCPSTMQNVQNIQQDGLNLTLLSNSTSGDLTGLCPITEAYQEGCVDVFIAFLAKILKVTGQVLIWIIIIEYVAAFLAIFLSCYIG
ncbi:23 kDa integral membrane protein [Bicyclus anynana]|uniref:Tetraspanin n=1 Tax=Bicyclus anynana TaxID=110368 RepID=A0ABM3LSC7_BICAN|nr:23 kDa integral membrane protein [Bicyclus anynana]